MSHAQTVLIRPRLPSADVPRSVRFRDMGDIPQTG